MYNSYNQLLYFTLGRESSSKNGILNEHDDLVDECEKNDAHISTNSRHEDQNVVSQVC